MPGRPPPAPSSNTDLLLINSSCESRYEAKAIAAFHLKVGYMFDHFHGDAYEISQMVSPERVRADESDNDISLVRSA